MVMCLRSQFILSFLLCGGFLWLTYGTNWISRRSFVADPSISLLTRSIAAIANRNASALSFVRMGLTTGSSKDLYHEFCNAQIKHYRPEVFHELRALAGVPQETLASLVSIDLQSIAADSKSGQLFLKSCDDLFVLKTISGSECRALRRVLDIFLRHVRETEHTCLGNVLGLFRIKHGFRRKYVLVTRNIFHPPLPLMKGDVAKYDLKGSSVGRSKTAQSDVWKDEDVRKHDARFRVLNPQRLLGALERDLSFLSNSQFMDYSLLVLCQRIPQVQDNFTMKSNDGAFTSVLSPFRSSSLDNRAPPILEGIDGSHLYQFGIIDFLQRYTIRKRLETLLKGLVKDRRGISCVPPTLYAERLLQFIQERVF